MSRDDFGELLRNTVSAILANVNTALPGYVKSYNALQRKADVVPAIKIPMDDGTERPFPVISGVPVIWPATQSMEIKAPLKSGDGVLIIVSTVALEQWARSTGKSQVATDDYRRFSLTDAFAIPGLFPPTGVPVSVPSSIEFKQNDDLAITGGAKITVDSTGNLELHGNGKSFVMWEDLNTALQAMMTTMNIQLAALFAACMPGTGVGPWVPTVLNISASQTTTVKTDG